MHGNDESTIYLLPTTTNIHDSEVMDVLLDKEEDSDLDLYDNSAYRSEAIEMAFIK
jgi:hypothetical protein